MYNVVILDDDQDFTYIITRIVKKRSRDIQLICFNSNIAFLTHVKENPNTNLIIVDYNLQNNVKGDDVLVSLKVGHETKKILCTKEDPETVEPSRNGYKIIYKTQLYLIGDIIMAEMKTQKVKDQFKEMENHIYVTKAAVNNAL